jgi:outer membrane protein, heavy metal efflux system
MKTLYKYSLLLLIVFTSLNAQTFEDYFRIAVENDPDLQSQYKTVEIALQQAAKVSALPDPGFSLGYFLSPVETRLGPQQLKLSLTQMFPWFGTLKAQKNAAALRADAAYQGFLDKRNALYHKLALAYYPLLERKAWLKIENEDLDNLKSLKILAERKYSNGKGSLVDVLRIDRMIEKAHSQLMILEEKEISLLTALNAFLGRPSDTPFLSTDDLDVDLLAGQETMAIHIESHPVIEALDLQLRAKDFAEKIAIRKGLPGFGLGLDYVIVGDRRDMIVAESGKDILMPMLSINIPLSRGKYRAMVKEARLEKEQLEWQRKALENSLETRYEKARFTLFQREEDIALYDSQIKTTLQMLDILMSRYRQDGSDLEELLRVERELLQYKKLRTSALAQYRITLAELQYITANIEN